jgi:lysozyme family protein
MKHPFDALAPEYAALLATAKVVPSRANEIDAVARKLIRFLPKYATVEAKTRVPAIWQATVFEREASSNFKLYFGNGDPLSRITTHVPAHRGPFTGPTAWEDGAIDALHVDRIEEVKDWTWPRFCYEGELWNGFGPRNHGRHTGYLWAGMTPYTGGKYVADGKWDPHHNDAQLGIVPVALRMIELEPSLALPAIALATPLADPVDHDAPASAPTGLGGDVRSLQTSLNALKVDGTPLDIDGSYGRDTRRAVRAFQASHHLVVDGLAGPKTIAALSDVIAEAGL